MCYEHILWAISLSMRRIVARSIIALDANFVSFSSRTTLTHNAEGRGEQHALGVEYIACSRQKNRTSFAT